MHKQSSIAPIQTRLIVRWVCWELEPELLISPMSHEDWVPALGICNSGVVGLQAGMLIWSRIMQGYANARIRVL
jgi:hypothetical protein